MKLKAVKMVVASLILSPTTASAVPQWVEDLCWYHANRVLPALDYRERQAYIANCKANYTAGSPPPPRGSKTPTDFDCLANVSYAGLPNAWRECLPVATDAIVNPRHAID